MYSTALDASKSFILTGYINVTTAFTNLIVASKVTNIVFSYHGDALPTPYIAFAWSKVSATNVEFFIVDSSGPSI